MKAGILIFGLCFIVASNPLFAIIDVFTEIEPSERKQGYHTKLSLKRHGDDKLLLTLPKLGGNSQVHAWLVVCEKARGEGARNFRYEVHWPESKANKSDIQLVIPINFDESGTANLHLAEDLVSRSYVVFGGYYDDGAFSTVNLPAFLKALDRKPKGEQDGGRKR